MDEQSIRRLNALNRAFYVQTANSFDESRGRDWLGWQRLLPYLAELPRPLRVLDVGCGNGRFGRFLARNFGLRGAVAYHGLDNSPSLLAAARDGLARMTALPDARLAVCDVVEEPLPDGQYHFVACFGVLHHVPSAARRETLMRAMGSRVLEGGYLCYSTWRFAEFDRFRERLNPLPEDIRGERGDYLMDWRRGEGSGALRYCHHVDQAEQAHLDAASGLEFVDSFCADGHTENINRYSLLRRERNQVGNADSDGE